MTAILAARIPGQGILVGSDSAWVSGHHLSRSGCKVLRVGDWIIGAAGTLKLDWEGLKDVEPPKTVKGWGKLLGPQKDAEVVLIRKRTIRYGEYLDGAWTWGVVKSKVLACGSGADYVVAAWSALEGYESDPERRMRQALRSTEKHCASVRGPFHLTWVP